MIRDWHDSDRKAQLGDYDENLAKSMTQDGITIRTLPDSNAVLRMELLVKDKERGTPIQIPFNFFPSLGTEKNGVSFMPYR